MLRDASNKSIKPAIANGIPKIASIRLPRRDP
jgi:hypothetical protein